MRVKSGLISLLALVFPASATLAQGTGRVVGTVRDADASVPLTNVSVTLVGTRFRGITTADGRYSITGVPAGTYRARAARLGFSPSEDSVVIGSGEVTKDFSLRTAAIALEAQVVVGYGTQRRAD